MWSYKRGVSVAADLKFICSRSLICIAVKYRHTQNITSWHLPHWFSHLGRILRIRGIRREKVNWIDVPVCFIYNRKNWWDTAFCDTVQPTQYFTHCGQCCCFYMRHFNIVDCSVRYIQLYKRQHSPILQTGGFVLLPPTNTVLHKGFKISMMCFFSAHAASFHHVSHFWANSVLHIKVFCIVLKI